MHPIDWLVIILPVLGILAIGLYTNRHMKSVAHFVSGGRVGGRYLLAVAKGEMQAGAVVFVASWEVFAKAGFVPSWWGWITGPVALVVAIFGFVMFLVLITLYLTVALLSLTIIPFLFFCLRYYTSTLSGREERVKDL